MSCNMYIVFLNKYSLNTGERHSSTLLKLFKGANTSFSIDDSATRPNFEDHLLLFDKDTKFPNILPIFKKGSKLVIA